MIALGWCRPTCHPPLPMTLRQCGKVAVLCTDFAGAARDRLSLQQQAFDDGIDLLPLAPGPIWRAEEVCKFTQSAADDLDTQLADLAGQCQATLTLHWSASVMPCPPDGLGRDWLRKVTRQHRDTQMQKDRAAELLAKLITFQPAQQGVPRYGPSSLNQSLLLARADFADFRHYLQKSASADSGISICLTGPWPAFEFVGAPLSPSEVLA